MFNSYVSQITRGYLVLGKLRVRLAGSKRVLDSSACRSPNPWDPPWNRWRIHLLQDAPSMAPMPKKPSPKSPVMGCRNHPQMVRLWHWVYQVIPHTSAGKKYGSLTSLSIDAPLPTVGISWSPTKGVLGGVKFETRHLSISQWHYDSHSIQSLSWHYLVSDGFSI